MQLRSTAGGLQFPDSYTVTKNPIPSRNQKKSRDADVRIATAYPAQEGVFSGRRPVNLLVGDWA